MSFFNTPSGDPLAKILIGDSLRMQHLRSKIYTLGPSTVPVFIAGPTGGGKELVANALHITSKRKGQFVAFNVCAVSDTMFEDALFGHIKGAFTGALAASSGYMAEADNGTLFLDEIGGLPGAAQVKLLRAIDLQQFRSVGSSRDSKSNFRAIAASNEDLRSMAQDGRFRADLYHRLATVTLEVPPLSERREDIPQLVNAFLSGVNAEASAGIAANALNDIMMGEWPGNVRQLKHFVALAATLAGSHVITRDVVREALEFAPKSQRSATVPDMKDRVLLQTLEETHGGIGETAKRLGVHRATIYRRLKRLQQQRPKHGRE